MKDVYDYIIVGAGSAGCVLADKLSASGKHTVLLIEAGPVDSNRYISIPKGFGKLLVDPRHVWFFATEPEPSTGMKPQYWVRGKTLGGSSSVNGMIYVRGQPEDYDDWERSGLDGWGWKSLAPYFKRMEDHALGGDEVRGAGGPLRVGPRTNRNQLSDAVIEAGRQLGLRVQDDLNRPDQGGIGYHTWNIRNGRRQSAVVAFLGPARKRSNLTVLTDTLVHSVQFSGTRATGVTAKRGADTLELRANREVILSAGAIQSPKLLQLSGIGPSDLLQRLGIPVRVHSPSVGQNLREHLLLFIQYKLKAGRSFNREFSGLPLFWNALRYLLTGGSELAAGAYDVGGFVSTQPGVTRPDVQLMMGPYSLDFSVPRVEFEAFPGLQIFSYQLRPESCGSVEARSSNPEDMPLIRPNYLATENDRRTAVAGVRYMRRWMAQPAMAPFLGEETTPGVAVQSDAEILEAFAQKGQAGYHAAGSCRMGVDANAVLDARLRVRGVTGLRVVDLSVVPTLVSGNTNAPVMAIAARAADLILEDAK